jgi:hypothetical protein
MPNASRAVLKGREQMVAESRLAVERRERENGNGKWKMENRKWKMENGQLIIDNNK